MSSDAPSPSTAETSVAVDAPAPGLVRLRMTVAYDGRAFHGFATQQGELATVAGALEDAVGRVLRTDVELACAGRTDAGVHAWGQVVHADVPAEGLDLGKLEHAVNRICGPQIVVRDLAVVDPSFHARFSARSRVYRYTVLNRPVPDPFLAATSWWVPEELDLNALRLACDPFIGEHDFSSFCRRPKPLPGAPEPTMVRRVIAARWHDEGHGILRLWIEASAFCHQMVRSITGTMVDVGRGRRSAGELLGVLQARDRHRAGTIAPPQGLCLWEVRYPAPPVV